MFSFRPYTGICKLANKGDGQSTNSLNHEILTVCVGSIGFSSLTPSVFAMAETEAGALVVANGEQLKQHATHEAWHRDLWQ